MRASNPVRRGRGVTADRTRSPGYQLAATHDHWFDEPVALHPTVVDAMEWAGCSVLALGVLLGTLIANA
jgi:hypothetical protein